MIPPFVIAIDGPAASGKGTLGLRLANHFHCHYLDTGSLYRLVAKKLLDAGIDLDDREKAVAIAKNLESEDLQMTGLREEAVGQAASYVSSKPEVRQALIEFQRKIARQPEGAVLEGRDIGTVICPDADIKLFIVADIESRAERRYKELLKYGKRVIYRDVLADLKERDMRDQGRDVAPLQPASDAYKLDTTEMNADEVFSEVLAHIASHVTSSSCDLGDRV